MKTSELVISDVAKIKFFPPGSPDLLEYCGDETDFYKAGFYDQNSPLAKLRIWQLEKVLSFLNLSGGKTWLDIGCGDGSVVDYLQQIKIDAIGIDPASNPGKNENLLKRDLESYVEKPSRKNEIFSMFDVLEHFKQPQKSLSDLIGLMESSNTVIIKVPNKGSLMYLAAKAMSFVKIGFATSILSRLYQVEYFPPHYYYFDRRSLVDLVEKSGLDVQEVQYITEMPIRFLWSRLWGFPKLIKLFIYPILFFMELLTPSKFKDSIFLIARKT